MGSRFCLGGGGCLGRTYQVNRFWVVNSADFWAFIDISPAPRGASFGRRSNVLAETCLGGHVKSNRGGLVWEWHRVERRDRYAAGHVAKQATMEETQRLWELFVFDEA